MCSPQSHGEASFPNNRTPQSCVYFGLTPGFFLNLLWIDRISLELKLLYVPGLLFLGWFFNKQNSLCADLTGEQTERGQLLSWQVSFLGLPGLLPNSGAVTSRCYWGRSLSGHWIFWRLGNLLYKAQDCRVGKLSSVLRSAVGFVCAISEVVRTPS